MPRLTTDQHHELELALSDLDMSALSIARTMGISENCAVRYAHAYRPSTDNLEQRQLGKQGLRRCMSCRDIKNPEDFNMLFGSRRRSRCRACEIAQDHVRRDNLSIEGRLRIVYTSGRTNAQARGRMFELTYDNILSLWERQQGFCYYTGLKMEAAARLPTTASIDRIDSARSYTLDNVVLCCWIVNRMKRDFPVSVFIDWCHKVAEGSRF